MGEILSRWMAKRMGKNGMMGMGNAMTFGKSGAKVYVEEAETGVTFEDVAVRVSPSFATRVHIDFDEANAADFQKGNLGMILT